MVKLPWLIGYLDEVVADLGGLGPTYEDNLVRSER